MKLTDDGLDAIFREAHTYSGWQDRTVSDETIEHIYRLAVLGPTSANCLPMRIIFVKSAAAKERLIPHTLDQNQEKTRQAPVTAIVGYDLEFHRHWPRLFPHGEAMAKMLANNEQLAYEYAMRNGSLQGAYLIIAIRAVGLAAGPMSGFDRKGVDEEFFAGTTVRSNFLCNFGYGDGASFHPRLVRLGFSETCTIA